MDKDEPGVTLGSLIKILKRNKKRPAVVMSTCGYCKSSYNINVGHMCPYIKQLYSKLESDELQD